jgi:hypothetical protein
VELKGTSFINKIKGQQKRGGRMNIKPETEIISDEEVNLYDYWKVLVKKKKIFIGIFLVPLVIVTIISMSLPRYYRGESEISIPALPAPTITSVITAPNIVTLMDNIDDTKKGKIFVNNSGAIKSVSVSLPKKSTDKINIIIDAKTSDMIPQAFKDMVDYLSNLPEIKAEIARIQAETDLKNERLLAETDLKIQKLIEVREANLIFLNDMTDMIKKRKLTFININPADLVNMDGDLSLEIINLQQAKSDMLKKKELNIKVTAGILGLHTITKQPSNAQIKNIIILTGILSFFVGMFVVFFLDYIDRMKARKNK